MAGQEALGLIETKGYVAAVEAADAALKSANVELVAYQRIGSGLVTGVFRGDVAAVTTAVETGSASASKVGDLVSRHVIPNPHGTVESLAK